MERCGSELVPYRSSQTGLVPALWMLTKAGRPGSNRNVCVRKGGQTLCGILWPLVNVSWTFEWTSQSVLQPTVGSLNAVSQEMQINF